MQISTEPSSGGVRGSSLYTAKDAIPTLEKLTEHEDAQIAERAKAALRQVRGS